MKTQKLLQKTLLIYLIYAGLVSIIIFPLFYYFTNHLYVSNTDEYLYHKKENFVRHLLKKIKIKDIEYWNETHLDVQILKNIQIKQDTFFNKAIFDEQEQEYEPYRWIYSPIKIENQNFVYSDKVSLLESEDLTESIGVLFAVMIFILFSGMLIITHQISKKIWQPFYSVLNDMEKFELDKNNFPDFQPSSVEEFERLNKSIENLIRRNMLVYESQKEFVENAAHELQTPVAVIKSKLDILIQNADITKEQAALLAEIDENISRLSRLNKNLLLLSKVDKQQYAHSEKIQINELIQKTIGFLNEQANASHISITHSFENNIVVYANKSLTEILIGNLLSNAVRHNQQNGKIIILIKNNTLIISNTGKTSAIPQEKLFKRFSKINPSEYGTGLGLSIVKKIADLYKWNISYKYENYFHTFEIRFQ